jgi:hypothetical protein
MWTEVPCFCPFLTLLLLNQTSAYRDAPMRCHSGKWAEDCPTGEHSVWGAPGWQEGDNLKQSRLGAQVSPLSSGEKVGDNTFREDLDWVLLFKLQPLPTISYLTDKITFIHISFITRTCMLIVWHVREFWAFLPTWSKQLSIPLLFLLLVLYMVHIEHSVPYRNIAICMQGCSFLLYESK